MFLHTMSSLTVSKMEIARKEGNRNVNRELDFYNIDFKFKEK